MLSLDTRLRTVHGLALCIVIYTAGLGVAADPPALTRLFPAGMQRGTTATVTATGKWATWPVSGWCDREGVQIKPLADAGKFEITVPADAYPGRCLIRLHDASGASEILPFVIDSLPEINEVDPNNLPKEAAVVERPTVINGVLEKRNDVDCFGYRLEAEQTLVAVLAANKLLEAPLDACLQVLNERGIVMAQNLDAQGLDPAITFRPPTAGMYFVRVFGFPATPDSTISFTGSEQMVYRLTLTTGGTLLGSLPLSLPEQDAAVEPVGVGKHIPAELRLLVARDARQQRATLFHPEVAGSLEVPLVTSRVLMEGVAATEVIEAFPVEITGQIAKPGEVDRYPIRVKKGQKLVAAISSQKLGYGLDAVLKIESDDGKQLAKEDDEKDRRDPALRWTAPADGQFTLAVSDLYGTGNEEHLYRLRVAEPVPEFSARADVDLLRGAVDQPIELTVNIERLNDFKGNVQVKLADGSPAMIESAPVISGSEGDSAKKVTLKLSAKEPFAGPVQLVAMVEGQTETSRLLSCGKFSIVDMWLTISAK